MIRLERTVLITKDRRNTKTTKNILYKIGRRSKCDSASFGLVSAKATKGLLTR